MGEFIKVVVVNLCGKRELCVAPAFSDIHEEDEVLVAIHDVETMGFVVCEEDMTKNSEAYDFLLKAFNTTEPKKVEGKIEYKYFTYKKEEGSDGT